MTMEVADWTGEGFKPQVGKTVVVFRAVQKKMEKASVDAGRPIFKEVIHIRKITSDRYLEIDRPVRDEDKVEYPQEWAQWERTRESRVLGTPIDTWPQLNDTQKAEFKAMKIYTVEQMAGLPDASCNMMGMKDLRDKAKVYLEMGRDAELLGKVRSEYELKIAEQDAKIAALMAAMEERTKPDKARG